MKATELIQAADMLSFMSSQSVGLKRGLEADKRSSDEIASTPIEHLSLDF